MDRYSQHKPLSVPQYEGRQQCGITAPYIIGCLITSQIVPGGSTYVPDSSFPAKNTPIRLDAGCKTKLGCKPVHLCFLVHCPTLCFTCCLFTHNLKVFCFSFYWNSENRRLVPRLLFERSWAGGGADAAQAADSERVGDTAVSQPGQTGHQAHVEVSVRALRRDTLCECRQVCAGFEIRRIHSGSQWPIRFYTTSGAWLLTSGRATVK